MLGESINYPLKGDSGVQNVAIGGMINLVYFLIIPWVLVWGYSVRAMEQAVGRKEAASWGDLGDLVVKGLIVNVLFYLYNLIPIAVAGFVFFTFGIGGGATGDIMAFITAIITGMFIALIAYILIGAIFMYVFPAAIANYLHQGSIGAAFSFGKIGSIVTSGAYFRGWLVGAGIFFGAFLVNGVIYSVLSFIPLVGTIVAHIAVAFVGFYAHVSAMYAWGLAYDAADAGVTTTTTDTVDESPTQV